MDLTKTLDKVDVERLYRHVLKLEGPKHPLDTPEKLREAADYVYAELEGYGVSVCAQEFQVKGFPDTFRNIEGWIGDDDAPSVVIINHYDNVYNDPGANDNAAGVAVMLEAARVLAEEKGIPTIRFVSATLEEGNPAIETRIRKSAQSLGLTDDQQRYTSYQVARIMKKHSELIGAAMEGGKSYPQAMAETMEELKDQMPQAVLKHLKELQEIYSGLTPAFSIGVTGKVGSSAWVDEAVEMGKKIKFAICLDEIGTISKQEHSQRLPPQLTYDMLQTFKVDREREIGDWAFVIADEASEKIGQTFCAHCKRDSIDLPHAFFQMPAFEQIAQQYPQAFGSDHAPFWRAGIPAMFAFDTANWRNHFGHSMADTIDKLDFDHITKICKAVIATAVDSTL